MTGKGQAFFLGWADLTPKSKIENRLKHWLLPSTNAENDMPVPHLDVLS